MQQAGLQIPLISSVPPATTDRLIELARDKNPKLRVLAVLLAGKRLEPGDMEPVLMSAVADPETAVRLVAVQMAGESESKPFAKRGRPFFLRGGLGA